MQIKLPSFYAFLLLVAISTLGFYWLDGSGVPTQPEQGPGGKSYAFESVIMEDLADSPDGYWLFRPEGFSGPTDRLIVFMHGYGAYNPMIYGGWIEHLVKKGNLVVFPRYQKNLTAPGPKKFTGLAATAIRQSIKDLQKKKLLNSDSFKWHVAGHSYGGVIAGGIAHDPEKYGLQKPESIFMCSPGTGPFKGGILEDYKGIDPETEMVIMVSENDRVVGDKFGKKVFETATQVKRINFLEQSPDSFGEARLTAHHDECYALNPAFDSGVKNFTFKRALRIGTTDALDYYGYWKIFDAMISCSEEDKNCHFAFGGTAEQLSLGNWNEENPVTPLVNISR